MQEGLGHATVAITLDAYSRFGDNPDNVLEVARRTRFVPLAILFFTGGLAALSWEVLWQLRASLALGVSTLGTALTLATTFSCMALGSLAGARLAAETPRPLAAYGVLELVIGISGLLMLPAFGWAEALDAALYRTLPALAPVLHVAAIASIIGPAATAMGATLPVLQRLAHEAGHSLARLYGVNTAGAALGVLVVSFVLLPQLGVRRTVLCVAGANVAIFVGTRVLSRRRVAEAGRAIGLRSGSTPDLRAMAVVFGTGFATFGLEVAWFRSLRSFFQATTDSFALMLAAVLVPLALGAGMAPWLRRRGAVPGALLLATACLVLLSMPCIERIDRIPFAASTYGALLLQWLGACVALMGPPMLMLGTLLPWYLEGCDGPRPAALLYASSTAGSVVGSIATGWLLLPTLGSTRTVWMLGVGLAVLANLPSKRRWLRSAAVAGAALSVAVSTTSSIGRDRLISSSRLHGAPRILAFDEGPDSTVSVVEDARGRALVIDGFVATREARTGAYMEWMGHLPMLLHPSPKRALVIAFGTGQTANAVRKQAPEALDVVEIDPSVFEVAPLFSSNERVLEDPRVRAIAMDGRAWLRRTTDCYDVVTLEPMPPHFAGVNALYSSEFYALLADRLSPGGIAAQWLPFHLLPPAFAAAAALSFRSVFPEALLWVDPTTGTGILLGRHGGETPSFGDEWPGLLRRAAALPLSDAEIRHAAALDAEGVFRLGGLAEVPVTDDNQLLAFGRVRSFLGGGGGRSVFERNQEIIRTLAAAKER